jgi:hypothetical protein
MKHGTCGECEALWREYGHATAEHINLIGEQLAALATRQDALANDLQPRVAAAEQRRIAAREKVQEH